MLTREDKIKEYMEKLKNSKYVELKGVKFSDCSSMQKWYEEESKAIRDEVKNNQLPSKERFLEIIDIAQIDDLKRDRQGIIPLSQQIKEYKDKVIELKRKVKSSDNLKFSSGRPMTNWLYYNLEKIKESKRNGELSEKSKLEAEAILEIKELVESYTEKKQELSFEDKVEEYRFKMFEIGRGINKNDDYTFSNGDSMNYFLDNELYKIKTITRKYNVIRKQDLSKIKDLAHIINCREYLEKENKSKIKHR